jgi:predicted transcriptional regulator
MSTPSLSRREREIMDVLYAAESLTAAEVRERMPSPPSYSAVRALLRILEEKGHIRHESGSLPYRYSPTVAPQHARRSALRHVVDTFFEGSVEQVVTTLLDESARTLSAADLDRLQNLIEKARQEGR